jgi:hypothetical protein
MDDTIFEDTTIFLVLRTKPWAREEGNKKEGAIGGLHTDIHMNVRKA